MYNELVSIIIPAYNASNFLSQAIDSALNQTYKNIEIIVVNDGSKDDGATEKAALSYGDKIKYYKKENGGCASALNYGIKKMSGKFFSWLSHDDLYTKDKIEKEINCYKENNLSTANTVISCGCQLINANREKIKYPIKNNIGFENGEKALQDLLLKGTFHGCGLLIPKAIIDDIGFFNESRHHQLDLEYWIKIIVSEYNFYILDERLSMNRVHDNQVTVKQKMSLKTESYDIMQNFSIQCEQKEIDTKYLKWFYYYCCLRNNEISKKFFELIKINCNNWMLIRFNGFLYFFIGKLRNLCGMLYQKMIRQKE